MYLCSPINIDKLVSINNETPIMTDPSNILQLQLPNASRELVPPSASIAMSSNQNPGHNIISLHNRNVPPLIMHHPAGWTAL